MVAVGRPSWTVRWWEVIYRSVVQEEGGIKTGRGAREGKEEKEKRRGEHRGRNADKASQAEKDVGELSEHA